MSPPTPLLTLITGATDGIGLALARHYRRQKRPLALIGRRPFADTPLATDFAPDDYCQAELSRPDCGELVADWLQSRAGGPVGLLIHNAASGYYGLTPHQPADSIRQVMAVNLAAPVALTHALLPQMARPGGQIVFISSVVAGLPCPDYAVYGASKAALDAFALNLRLELGDELTVQIVRPGATRSGMHAKSGLPPEKVNWRSFPPAETVAVQIARAIEGRRAAVTLGWGNRLAHWGGRHLGGWLDAALRRGRR
ncbi:MAG: SDR family oxidoreductase [Anaerolineae bacterium]